MSDLFRVAAEAAAAAAAAEATPPRIHQQQQQPRQTQFADDSSFGGHNLRTVIRDNTTGLTRNRVTGGTARPLSSLAGGGTRHVLNIPDDNMVQLPREPPAQSINATDDDSSHTSDDIDAVNLGDGHDEAALDNQDDYQQGEPTDEYHQEQQQTSPNTTAHAPTPTTTIPQPFFYTHIANPSGLAMAAARLAREHGLGTGQTLHWQADTGGDNAKIKSFRQDILQQLDLVAFAFMRPGSGFIQVMHSPATFSVQGGDAEMKGKDYGFVGDRSDIIPHPSAVLIEDKVWKWVTKKVNLDITPLEFFYAIPGNDRKFWHPTNREGEQDVAVPRILLLPTAFLAYCVDKPRTPFDLHQFVAMYATSATSEITINDCQLVRDWCIVAAHHENSSNTNSTLAHTFPTAPTHDEVFARWLNKVVNTTLGSASTPAAQPHPAPVQAAPTVQPHPAPVEQPQPVAPPMAPLNTPWVPPGLPPPPQDMWAQIAANLTQGIASVAASLQPPQTTRGDSTTAYEEGGKYYDDFQLAVIKGFSHTHDANQVQQIWPMFQMTKHMDTHRDNIKRKMVDWALSITPTKREQVQIERGLYIAKQTMQDILALRFNPGGGSAELSTVTQGLSILACRAISAEDRQAIRRKELLEPQASKRSMAEMEQDLPGYTDQQLYPDDFNELHRCLGTYCALLHTLFGERCAFYKHCYRIWLTMQSDTVYEHRTKFSPLFCRSIVWAIVDDSRHYFSQRLTMDDFAGQFPEDIAYPRSNLIEIEPNIRRGTPIVRFSFPAAWTAALERTGPGLGGGQHLQAVPAVVSGGGTQASVVSGVTLGSRNTRNSQGQSQRPRISIRTTDIHPTIKAAMEPYIAKFQSIRLNQLLTKLNITVDDLPTLPAAVGGANGVCYNHILGFCTLDSCRHQDGHVKVEHVTDEFATDLIARLRPAITDFMTNGLPPRQRNRGRRRQRTE